METTFLLAGGDRRQFWLARLLGSKGRVFSVGVPERTDCLPDVPADILILPTPCCNPCGRLRCASLPEGLDPAILRGTYDIHTRVYGGAMPKMPDALLPDCGPAFDLLTDPTVAAVNGRLTAEAAVSLVMEQTEDSLFAQSCLVLGWGRIGKPLALLLSGLGAQVSVAARRPAIRAEAAQLGFAVRDFETPGPAPALVFNTVPAPALSRTALNALGETLLWVELASAPGGLPSGWEPPFAVLHANSLPGKRLPYAAARALMDGILHREGMQ